MKGLSLALALLLSTAVFSQEWAEDELFGDGRVWYSAYLYKKLNYRWSVDVFALTAMRSFEHNFWLGQVNLGANYRINRFWTFSFGYGHAVYPYSDWWEDRYEQDPNFLNTIGFSVLNLSIRRDNNIGKWLRLSNRFTIQYYIPRFEKYQIRPQYNVRLSYRKSNLPLRLRPFVQGALYYYYNGVEVDYYDEDFNVVETEAPNGLHRFRVRAGLNFRPFKKVKSLYMVLYYGLNKEFNLEGFGNELNFLRPSEDGERFFTTYRFNNYTIYGVQFNYFL